MPTRLRRDTDDEIYIYINEEDPTLNWNWNNDDLDEKYGINVEEIKYCFIAFCSFLVVFFLL
jgi:hypothetical protein